MTSPKHQEMFLQYLEQHKIILSKTPEQMNKMIGFRNIAVHDYQYISLDIVKSIIENNLPDLECFSKKIINAKLYSYIIINRELAITFR